TDKQLPQVLRIRDLLSRGIAVHHGGLLPLIKEMVEMLFTRGLVKVLFATETFAMGVNAPARAVVFSAIRKHDGRGFRDLLPGEYTQMSGRAGRRGLDPTGVVIIACNEEIPEQLRLSQMIQGTPTKLESQFRLTYTMILNLLRVEALKVEEMIKRSFSENSTQKMLPEQQREFEERQQALSTLPQLACAVCAADLPRFHRASAAAVQLGRQIRERALRHPVGLRSAAPGRLVVVAAPVAGLRNAPAVVLKSGVPPPVAAAAVGMAAGTAGTPGTGPAAAAAAARHAFTVLALVDADAADAGGFDFAPLPANMVGVPPAGRRAVRLASVLYSELEFVTTVTVKVDVEAAMRQDAAELARVCDALGRAGEEMRDSGVIPEVDWSRIREIEFQEWLAERARLLGSLPRFQCAQCPDLAEHYGVVHREHELRRRLAELAFAISDQNLELLPDYRQRVGVLRDMGFVDEAGTVQLKGRVACEINTADELVLTELILDNFFADFDAAELVALLSCFVFQEKSQSEPRLTPKLQKGIETIKQKAVLVNAAQRARGLDVGGPQDAVAALKFGLVEAVHEWARGVAFREITELTDVLE
ncbi:hypothetical protein HK405_010364, partial [Cladochytrium tenue]